MPSRKVEKLRTDSFQVGASYSRPQIAELGGVAALDNTREWTGIVEFENCILLFPTLDKSDLPPEHRYVDVFAAELRGRGVKGYSIITPRFTVQKSRIPKFVKNSADEIEAGIAQNAEKEKFRIGGFQLSRIPDFPGSFTCVEENTVSAYGLFDGSIGREK